jgi:hypothetical protein
MPAEGLSPRVRAAGISVNTMSPEKAGPGRTEPPLEPRVATNCGVDEPAVASQITTAAVAVAPRLGYLAME